QLCVRRRRSCAPPRTRSSRAFIRLDHTELSFGSALTGRWQGMPVSGLALFFCARNHGAAHAIRHEFSFLQYAGGYASDPDLLAASSVTSLTSMPAGRRHSTNTAIDR